MEKKLTFLLHTALIMLCLCCFGAFQSQAQINESMNENPAGTKPARHVSTGTVTSPVSQLQPLQLLRGNTAYGFNVWDENSTYPKYVSFDVAAPQTVTDITTPSLSFVAGEYYDGAYYCSEENNGFYRLDPATGTATLISTQSTSFQDMAYDYSTNKMYGINSTGLYTIDLNTGYFTFINAVAGMTETPITLACDLAGNMYSIEVTTGYFYSINKTTATATLIASTNTPTRYRQTMGFDHNTGILYWANCNEDDGVFGIINPATGSVTSLGMLGANIELIGFYVPYTAVLTCDAPTNMTVASFETELQLSWDPPADASNLVEYLIYQDLAQTPLATTTNTYYTVNQSLQPGVQYCYTVKAYYNNTCLSDPSNSDCGQLTVGINENRANNQVKLFPNPTSNVLNVSAPGYQSFEIINYLGQVINSRSLTNEQTIINVANLSDGFYFIKLKNKDHVTTMKFIKR